MVQTKPHDEVLLLRPTRGLASLNLKDLWVYRELVYFMVWRDVKVKYKQTLLGMAWAVVQPVMTMIVFTFVFDRVAKLPTDGIPYPVFSFTGLLPWGLFATALNQGSRALVAHNNMITKIYFPRLILPMSSVFEGLVDFVIAYFILTGLMIYFNVPPAWGRLWTLPFFLLLALMTALRALLQTGRESLLQGVENLATDLKRGHGILAISQTDLDAYKVGENVATSPGQVVFRNRVFELIQYAPSTETVHEVPLLIFPPWINKFYILDLQPKSSMIRWLTQQGHTVFLVSWVNPDEDMAEADFEDYMQEGAYAAVQAVQDATGVERMNTVGYCVGGTLLAATAHMAKTGDNSPLLREFFAASLAVYTVLSTKFDRLRCVAWRIALAKFLEAEAAMSENLSGDCAARLNLDGHAGLLEDAPMAVLDAVGQQLRGGE